MISSLRLLLVLIVVTGFFYPLAVTGIAHLLFPVQANGNPYLIGQKFTSSRYFWGRPSAVDYNPLPSKGSNLSPTSALLQKQVEERREALMKAHEKPVPSLLLYASGSGLDPHLSPEAVEFQLDRVAAARGLTVKEVSEKIKICETTHFLGIPCVNVLELNQALDEGP